MAVLVTGASGWIGSAVVPQLLAAGHEVASLARSDASASALAASGATVVRGDLDDLATLRSAAGASDGVIHLAFKHDIAFTGDFAAAAAADRAAVAAVGDALAGSDRPLVIASGLLGLAPGRVATEDDGRDPALVDALRARTGPAVERLATAQMTLGLADRGVRSSVVRLPPTCHGDGDGGFVATLVALARRTGVAGYLGDGSSRWPAVHRLDAAAAFRLALDRAPAGSVLHAVADEGVAMRPIAEVIGRHLGVPTRSMTPDEAGHFGHLAGFVGLDSPASSGRTRQVLGWEPAGPGLLADLDAGHYFA